MGARRTLDAVSARDATSVEASYVFSMRQAFPSSMTLRATVMLTAEGGASPASQLGGGPYAQTTSNLGGSISTSRATKPLSAPSPHGVAEALLQSLGRVSLSHQNREGTHEG